MYPDSSWRGSGKPPWMSVISYRFPASYVQQSTVTRTTLFIGVILIFTGLVLYRLIAYRSDWNMDVKHIKEYAKLVKKAESLFVEPKGYVFVGYSRKRMNLSNMPSHNKLKSLD